MVEDHQEEQLEEQLEGLLERGLEREEPTERNLDLEQEELDQPITENPV